MVLVQPSILDIWQALNLGSLLDKASNFSSSSPIGRPDLYLSLVELYPDLNLANHSRQVLSLTQPSLGLVCIPLGMPRRFPLGLLVWPGQETGLRMGSARGGVVK